MRGEEEEQRWCLANEVMWMELVGRSPHIPEALRQCRTLKQEELWSCFRPILAHLVVWADPVHWEPLSLSLSLPYNGRKYLNSSSSCWTFLCGTVVWMCRERERERRRVGGKYVSHSLGEVAVVLEEEGH